MKAIFTDGKSIEVNSTSKWANINQDNSFSISLRSTVELDLEKVLTIVKNNHSTITVESENDTDIYEGYTLSNAVVHNQEGIKMLELKLR